MLRIPVTFVVFGTKALNEDENYIERPQIEEYLKSADWAHKKKCKNIFVSVTHFHRNDPGSEPGLGQSDDLFLNGVIIGYVEDSWISKDGKSWEGTIVIFDDLSQYAEQQKPMILQVLRLVNNGVSVGISCCLAGDWDDSDGKLNKLFEYVGADLTLQPAFSKSEIHSDKIKS